MSGLKPDRMMQLIDIIGAEPAGEYLHWDKMRHLEPPDGFSHTEWWAAIKLQRSGSRTIPLVATDGKRFSYTAPEIVERLLHFVDKRCAGTIAMPEVVTSGERAKQHFLVNSLMEEAIRSSQLEGATTSRKSALSLLRTGRAPKDRSERMIVNNHRALEFMREEIGEILTPGAVLELQRILTDGTLENPDAAGRLQRPEDDRVAVFDRQEDSAIHVPPPAEELPARMQAMCDFANELDSDGFVHPVVRAILLHFWLAYDHPFEDGNGRTARALFYWHMKTNGYWLAEYLSISAILREAPAKYMRSYLYAETDDNDATYFIVHQLKVIERAVEQLHVHLNREVRELRNVDALLKGAGGFNQRQLTLLAEAIRDPDSNYTYQSHAVSHGVTHETARNDLIELADAGLIELRRSSRPHSYTPAPNLAKLLRRSS